MNKVAFARFVSIVGHPFTFIALLLLIPFFRRGDTSALRITAVVVVVAFVPLVLFMRQRYSSGRWQTVDASGRADRPEAYLVGLVVLLVIGLYFHLIERSPRLVRAVVVFGLMTGVAAGINRWIKVSGHVATAVFSALVLGRVNLAWGIAIGLFVPLVAWSRLALLRHTLPEVIGGSILGAVAAVILFYWN